ncbi:uncharacterized protein LTR77_009343 [Saxophila tyrrhenica]|uniref:Uncharacterized protein n=1 Tax=Saxophila tyrrhenica TaxID=1690608 RepID=A0AAV9P1P8_9PEZI|nr:hypothetical protein LTR77_009343 [Saxophila tyrrhenica]
MASRSPLVLEGVNLPGFIQYVLDKHTAPSTIVTCCTKDAFMKELQTSLADESSAQADGRDFQAASRKQRWAKPTLRLLAASRTVRLVFCPELAHLRAYLATYAYRGPEDMSPGSQRFDTPSPPRILAVFNPIQLHKPTSAYSAQGINRTFATAVDAAYCTHSQLILAECPLADDSSHTEGVLPWEDMPAVADPQSEMAPWDQPVSILNVTTKSFGVGERGWVGRTTAIETIKVVPQTPSGYLKNYEA